MLLRHIEWVGDVVRVHLDDTDGSKTVIDLNADDALDLCGWLLQEKTRLIETLRRRMKAFQKEEQAS
jgi:hypothetical protein